MALLLSRILRRLSFRPSNTLKRYQLSEILTSVAFGCFFVVGLMHFQQHGFSVGLFSLVPIQVFLATALFIVHKRKRALQQALSHEKRYTEIVAQVLPGYIFGQGETWVFAPRVSENKTDLQIPNNVVLGSALVVNEHIFVFAEKKELETIRAGDPITFNLFPDLGLITEIDGREIKTCCWVEPRLKTERQMKLQEILSKEPTQREKEMSLLLRDALYQKNFAQQLTFGILGLLITSILVYMLGWPAYLESSNAKMRWHFWMVSSFATVWIFYLSTRKNWTSFFRQLFFCVAFSYVAGLAAQVFVEISLFGSLERISSAWSTNPLTTLRVFLALPIVAGAWFYGVLVFGITMFPKLFRVSLSLDSRS